jgi:hypothetical protein
MTEIDRRPAEHRIVNQQQNGTRSLLSIRRLREISSAARDEVS